jgi:hypothetical protein
MDLDQVIMNLDRVFPTMRIINVKALACLHFLLKSQSLNSQN